MKWVLYTLLDGERKEAYDRMSALISKREKLFRSYGIDREWKARQIASLDTLIDECAAILDGRA